MAVIRGALAIFVSILLFVVFLAGNALLTLTLSLQYENVYEHLESLIQDTVEEEMDVDISAEIQKELDTANINCEDYPEGYVFSEGEYTITLSGDVLTQGTDAIIASGVESLIKEAYYREYTCDFWKCFGEEEIPLFLVSEYAKDYWKSKFYLTLGTAIGLMILLFFLYRKKHNTFVVPGILLMAAALPFLRMNLLMSISGDRIIFELLGIFFSKAKAVFKISFFTGLGLIGFGIIFRLFMAGFRFSQLFNRGESIKKPSKKSDDKNIKDKREFKTAKDIKKVQKSKKK
jgi:hypothetical protein